MNNFCFERLYIYMYLIINYNGFNVKKNHITPQALEIFIYYGQGEKITGFAPETNVLRL